MKSALFCLLSLADLALTWWLLATSGGQASEANAPPVDQRAIAEE